MRLPLRICDNDRVCRVVDDDPVVDVVVNNVRRRGSDLPRRDNPDRHRPILRHRQHESDHRRWRRGQVYEIDRRRRKKDCRRLGRRSKTEIRIIEHEHRSVDVNNFVRRRWRDIVFDHFNSRWGLESSGKLVQAAPRIL